MNKNYLTFIFPKRTLIRLNRKFWAVFIIFLILSSLILFFRLDQPSIRMWDESRQAVNALEMSQNGNFWVTYFEGKPDHWNVKPPLLIWCMVIAMKIFGYNAFSVRISSAICVMAVGIMIFLFCYLYLGNLKMGFASGMILMTSRGFVGEHVARTGDYDAMLSLWIIIYSLSFFIYLNSLRKTPNHCYLFVATIAAILAVLTKGIAGILAWPALVIYASWEKKLIKLLRLPQLYYCITVFGVVVLGYYFIREIYDPGYVNEVMKNELLGRYLDVVEKHEAPVYFYLQEFHNNFNPWFYLVFSSFLLLYFNPNKLISKLGIFSGIYLLLYFLILSFSKTKLPWYNAPMYPIASLINGVAIIQLFEGWQKQTKLKSRLRQSLITVLFSIALFILPFADTFYNHIYINQGMLYSWSQNNPPNLMYGDYFQKLLSQKPDLKEFSVLIGEEYNAHLTFYKQLQKLAGYSINIITQKDALQAQQIVITCEPQAKAFLDQNYKTDLLDNYESCYTLIIKGRK